MRSGYREKVQIPGGPNLTLLVVKENGQYKLLEDTTERPNSIALEMLDRIKAGNLQGAKVLLDWLREDQHLGGGDDHAGRTGVSAVLDQGRSGGCAQDDAGRGRDHGGHKADGGDRE